jgi:hypothetical protein
MAALVKERYPQFLTGGSAGTPVVSVLFNTDGSVDHTSYEILARGADPKVTIAYLAKRLQIPEAGIEYAGAVRVPSTSNGAVVVAFTEPRQGSTKPPSTPFVSNMVRTPDTRAIDRLLATRYFPESLRRGVAADERLWVLFDSDGQVLRTGDEKGGGSTPITSVLTSRYPGIETQYVTVTPVTNEKLEILKDAGSRPVQLYSVWLKKGSPSP